MTSASRRPSPIRKQKHGWVSGLNKVQVVNLWSGGNLIWSQWGWSVRSSDFTGPFEDPSEASNACVGVGVKFCVLYLEMVCQVHTLQIPQNSVSLPCNAFFSCWEHTAPMVLLQSWWWMVTSTLRTSSRLDHCFPFPLSTTSVLKPGVQYTAGIVAFLASLAAPDFSHQVSFLVTFPLLW